MHLGTAKTVSFVLQRAASSDRILEIGAGSGAVAAELGRHGLSVVALDRSIKTMPSEQQPRVQVVESDFLDYHDERFDVLLFSRSLHHIRPLAQAVERAAQLLKPAGVLLVEDFSVDAPDQSTAQWFYGVASLLSAAGAYPQGRLTIPTDPLGQWHEEHNGHRSIASRESMATELCPRFRLIEEQNLTYLFRYFEDALSAGPDGSQMLAAIERWEQDMIDRQMLEAVGWRSVWALPQGS